MTLSAVSLVSPGVLHCAGCDGSGDVVLGPISRTLKSVEVFKQQHAACLVRVSAWQPHEDRAAAFFRIHERDPECAADVWQERNGSWSWAVSVGDVRLASSSGIRGDTGPAAEVRAKQEATRALNRRALERGAM